MSEEREAVGALVRPLEISIHTKMNIADAVDTYAKAERLEEHGLTCPKASPAYREDGVLIKTENNNGEQWYCYCGRGKELTK